MATGPTRWSARVPFWRMRPIPIWCRSALSRKTVAILLSDNPFRLPLTSMKATHRCTASSYSIVQNPGTISRRPPTIASKGRDRIDRRMSAIFGSLVHAKWRASISSMQTRNLACTRAVASLHLSEPRDVGIGLQHQPRVASQGWNVGSQIGAERLPSCRRAQFKRKFPGYSQLHAIFGPIMSVSTQLDWVKAAVQAQFELAMPPD